jgi:adenosylhomocysteine nucleosidase
MPKNTLIITALQTELDQSRLPSNLHVVYSGVGKINATITTLKAIEQYKPAQVINFGTVGSIKPHLSGLIEIRRVIQRDMVAESLAPRGRVPFCERPHEYFARSGQHTCATGDSFVTAKDPWLDHQGVDVVDMELYAIAVVAHMHGVPWTSFKYITDHTNEDSASDWNAKVNHGEDLFLEHLRSTF